MAAKEERNKALVLETMTSLFRHKDPLSAERLYAANFIHHDPDLRQGRQVLAKIVAKLPSAISYEPGLIVAEGDYVALHERIRGWAPRTQIVTDISLTRVFSECDADLRMKAIREIYTEDAVLYEPHAAVTGHAAISDAVTALLAGLPQDFSFRADCAALGHHGVGHLRWRSGPPNCPAAMTGSDIARIEGGRIRSLHIFVDSAAISD
jgi:predicted SnoaL-like aldol condensation-catalyzing enzyme